MKTKQEVMMGIGSAIALEWALYNAKKLAETEFKVAKAHVESDLNALNCIRELFPDENDEVACEVIERWEKTVADAKIAMVHAYAWYKNLCRKHAASIRLLKKRHEVPFFVSVKKHNVSFFLRFVPVGNPDGKDDYDVVQGWEALHHEN